jgi:hypothetical protein
MQVVFGTGGTDVPPVPSNFWTTTSGNLPGVEQLELAYFASVNYMEFALCGTNRFSICCLNQLHGGVRGSGGHLPPSTL